MPGNIVTELLTVTNPRERERENKIRILFYIVPYLKIYQGTTLLIIV